MDQPLALTEALKKKAQNVVDYLKSGWRYFVVAFLVYWLWSASLGFVTLPAPTGVYSGLRLFGDSETRMIVAPAVALAAFLQHRGITRSGLAFDLKFVFMTPVWACLLLSVGLGVLAARGVGEFFMTAALVMIGGAMLMFGTAPFILVGSSFILLVCKLASPPTTTP